MPSIDGKKAAILNSRQNIRPLGNDAWIINTGQAVRQMVRRGYRILTSIGMNSWEFVLYFASYYKAQAEIYIPAQSTIDAEKTKADIARQFNLKSDLTFWHTIKIKDIKKDKHYFRKHRDELITADADLLIPVSIRQNGNMMNLLNKHQDKGKTINYDYLIEYRSSVRSYKYEIERNRINPDIDKQLNDYLIHWTRTSAKPWPDETKYQYYLDIVNAQNEYPRNTLATLKRILKSQKIISSSRHYRKNMAAVAFSALTPVKAASLMKWRARYREMSFEPYGIGIEKGFAENIGIRKVIYGPANGYQKLNEEDKLYFQSIGAKGDWLPEKEFRFIGNLDLDKIPIEKLTAIVWKPEEKDTTQEIFPGRILSFYT